MTAAEAMAAGTVLRVDPIACDGRGLCAEVLPELIRMDDWGFPIIANGVVPAGLRPAAAEAVRICPKLALKLEPAETGGSAARSRLSLHSSALRRCSLMGDGRAAVTGP
jgi:ferredoxin